MENDDDFLDAIEADNAGTPVVDAQAEAPVEPAQPEPEVLLLDDPVTPAEPPKEVKPPEPMRNDDAADGRLAALLDERDKRKAAEAERDALRAAQQQQQQQPVQMPDPYEDPEGFASFQQAQVAASIQNITLNTSERFARKEHGAETVDAAKSWAMQRFASDPLYQQQVLNDPDPYERVVTDWRRDQVFAEVSDPKEFEQFRAWKQAQNQLANPSGGAPPPSNVASAIPRRSLASAPSAGNMLTEPVQDDGEIFDEVIPKR